MRDRSLPAGSNPSTLAGLSLEALALRTTTATALLYCVAKSSPNAPVGAGLANVQRLIDEAAELASPRSSSPAASLHPQDIYEMLAHAAARCPPPDLQLHAPPRSRSTSVRVPASVSSCSEPRWRRDEHLRATVEGKRGQMPSKNRLLRERDCACWASTTETPVT